MDVTSGFFHDSFDVVPAWKVLKMLFKRLQNATRRVIIVDQLARVYSGRATVPAKPQTNKHLREPRR